MSDLDNINQIRDLISKRIQILKDLQDERDSILISYVSKNSMDINDAVRMYTVLHDIVDDLGENKINKVDLFLFSSGGSIDAAYRLVNIIRQYCEEFRIIVPFYAKSAATLLCLGADKLVMGPISELGPIDPQVASSSLEFGGPVQAIRDCIDYIYNKLDAAENQDIMESIMYPIINKIDPWVLGNFERQVKVSKQYAYQLLNKYMLSSKSDVEINEVVNKLTEEYYSHGYVIGKNEAKNIGLNTEDYNKDHWDIIWKLYLNYFEQLVKTQKDITLIESECTLTFEFNRIKTFYDSKDEIEFQDCKEDNKNEAEDDENEISDDSEE